MPLQVQCAWCAVVLDAEHAFKMRFDPGEGSLFGLKTSNSNHKVHFLDVCPWCYVEAKPDEYDAKVHLKMKRQKQYAAFKTTSPPKYP